MVRSSAATDTDVLIVGAGPTGLMAAAELARRKVRVRLVERAARPSNLSRAVTVHARTMELWDLLGCLQPALDLGVKVHGLDVYQLGEHLAYLDFTHLDSPYQYMLDLAENDVEGILRERLAGLGGEVEWGCDLLSIDQTDEAVEVVLRHGSGREEICRASWLIGCDGAHSVVRHAMGLSFDGKEYDWDLALMEARIDWSRPTDSYQFFLRPTGSLLVFPLRDGIYRLQVDLPPGEVQRLPEVPDLAEFQGYMQTRGDPEAVLRDPGWTARFRIHERIASHYRLGRLFVAGDAAHLHSPAGGQGLNTGLQDALNLAWKLGMVVHGRAPSSLLDSYEAERRPVGQHVLRLSDMLTHAPVATATLPAAPDHLFSLVARLPTVAHALANTMGELDIGYRHSPLVVDSCTPSSPGPRAGDRVPDAQPVGTPDGRIFSTLRHSGHTVLLFEGLNAAPRATMMALQETIERQHPTGVRCYLVCVADTPPGEGFIADPVGAAHQRFGANEGRAFVTRPDGYLAVRTDMAHLDEIPAYLDRLFATGPAPKTEA